MIVEATATAWPRDRTVHAGNLLRMAHIGVGRVWLSFGELLHVLPLSGVDGEPT